MQSIEYLRWAPAASPIRVEFRAGLLRGLGLAQMSGILYGTRSGREVRITALRGNPSEQLEKVGVFVSRLRGEVFLTEEDLAFMMEQSATLALVISGDRGGFFVCESNGSIQTVRSHEEFTVTLAPAAPLRTPVKAAPPPRRKWTPAVAMAALPLAALAVMPQRAAQTSGVIEIRDLNHQLHISWQPAQNAVLSITDGGAIVTIPVRADQSTVTYAPRGSAIEVSLTGLNKLVAHYDATVSERQVVRQHEKSPH